MLKWLLLYSSFHGAREHEHPQICPTLHPNALHFVAGVWSLEAIFVYILRYELVQIKPSHFRPHGYTSSSAMAERPRELDQRFQMGGQFEAIID